MTYELRFHPDALAEWRKLDATVSALFKKKLAERLQHPRVPAGKPRADCESNSCSHRPRHRQARLIDQNAGLQA